MARSITYSILTILSLFIQVAVVSAVLEAGLYSIRNQDGFLAIGAVPPIYPPLDVPLQVSYRYAVLWNVAQIANGYYTISEPSPKYSDSYKVIEKDKDDVFASTNKLALSLDVKSVGGNQYTISVANENRFFTYQKDKVPQVVLRPASGLTAQKWIFQRAEKP
ncbi:hypothetical protein BGW39_000744 [Mortierella sp. 14UC]|nr:hypothetical protein BGW39_000744 [Mortierella sp. 14UC]